MLTFILGFIIGGMLGAFFMALLQAKKGDDK